jgi:hypothetical protein
MSRRLRVLLVSSSGGVLLDVLALRPWWQRHDTCWVSTAATDTEVALSGHRVVWQAAPPTWVHVLPATWRAVRLLHRERPDLVVSAGRALAVPYFLAARVARVRTVWLETLIETGRPSRSARLCGRLAGTVLVQRAARLSAHRDAVLVGELY